MRSARKRRDQQRTPANTSYPAQQKVPLSTTSNNPAPPQAPSPALPPAFGF
ncbi:UNVERIFIED_CONTAM: hypothetical protein FKN15_028688 [Acipenser sinensis]